MDDFLHYLKLIFRFFENSLIRDMSFRTNFFIRLFTDIIYYVVNIAFFQVIYLQTDDINGWNFHQIIIFLGTMFIVDSLHMSLFYFNVMRIPYLVRTGELDQVLLKPIYSGFIVSLRSISFSSLGNVLLGFGVVIYGLIGQSQPISFIQIIMYLLFIVLGVSIMYSILFICATLAIYITRTEKLIEAIFGIFQISMKPDIIYKGFVKTVLTYIIPILLVVNFPTRIIIDQISLSNLLWGGFISIFFVALSQWFWMFSIKRYKSASS